MDGTVLVADDDRTIRTVLTQALGRQGYDVRTTGTAATLWQWVSNGEGDLVITDVVLVSPSGTVCTRSHDVVPELYSQVTIASSQSSSCT